MANCQFSGDCSYLDDRTTCEEEPTMGVALVNYCQDVFEDCARYAVFLTRGSVAVPGDLGPEDRTRAIQLVLAGYETSGA